MDGPSKNFVKINLKGLAKFGNFIFFSFKKLDTSFSISSFDQLFKLNNCLLKSLKFSSNEESNFLLISGIM